MSAHARTALTDSESKQLNDALEAAGIYLLLESQDGAVILTGEVESAEMREAAIDLAEAMALPRGLRIENAIDVLDVPSGFDPTADIAVVDERRLSPGSSTLTDLGTVDAEEAGEEAIPYFPPTDPVISVSSAESDDPEILGGFQTTSMQDDDAIEQQPFRGDEDITVDVLRELREDATTTDLHITVHTRNKVVFLVGEVESMDDAENAEAVAARVLGVTEVREELKIRSMMSDHNR